MGYRAKHERHRKPRRILRTILLLILLVLLLYPLTEPYLLQVETRALTGTSLPAGVGRLRIVYLSDIHEGSWPFFTHSRTVELVRKINSFNADLVILGGDYAQDSDSAIAFFESLPRIRANYGVYGIVGNHDRTTPESNLPKLRAAMYAAGVTPLVNDVASVRIGTSDIYLVGIDDVDNGWPDLSGMAKKVSADDFVVFLSHSPAVISETLSVTDRSGHKGWYDLGLFGHTHGGQVALLGGLLGISKVDSRHTSGWLVENKTPLLISNGVGTSVLPVRLFCPPQLHVINITSGK